MGRRNVAAWRPGRRCGGLWASAALAFAACASVPPPCPAPVAPVSMPLEPTPAVAVLELDDAARAESDALDAAFADADSVGRTVDDWRALRARLDALLAERATSSDGARWSYLGIVATCPETDACRVPTEDLARELVARATAAADRYPTDPETLRGVVHVVDACIRAGRYVDAYDALLVGNRARPDSGELAARVRFVHLALHAAEMASAGELGRDYASWSAALAPELEGIRVEIGRERASDSRSAVGSFQLGRDVALLMMRLADFRPQDFGSLAESLGLERAESTRLALAVARATLDRGQGGAAAQRILDGFQVFDDDVALDADDVAFIGTLLCTTRIPLSAVRLSSLERRGLPSPFACPVDSRLDSLVVHRAIAPLQPALDACRSRPPRRGSAPAAPVAHVTVDEDRVAHVVLATPSTSRAETTCAARVLASHPTLEGPVVLSGPVDVALWRPLVDRRTGCMGPLCGLHRGYGGNGSIQLGDDLH